MGCPMSLEIRLNIYQASILSSPFPACLMDQGEVPNPRLNLAFSLHLAVHTLPLG